MYGSVLERGCRGAASGLWLEGGWKVAEREGVQHAVSDAGWRLGRRDSGLHPGSYWTRLHALLDRSIGKVSIGT